MRAPLETRSLIFSASERKSTKEITEPFSPLTLKELGETQKEGQSSNRNQNKTRNSKNAMKGRLGTGPRTSSVKLTISGPQHTLGLRSWRPGTGPRCETGIQKSAGGIAGTSAGRNRGAGWTAGTGASKLSCLSVHRRRSLPEHFCQHPHSCQHLCRHPRHHFSGIPVSGSCTKSQGSQGLEKCYGRGRPVQGELREGAPYPPHFVTWDAQRARAPPKYSQPSASKQQDPTI